MNAIRLNSLHLNINTHTSRGQITHCYCFGYRGYEYALYRHHIGSGVQYHISRRDNKSQDVDIK